VLIQRALTDSMLVEAAAGTGKTTSMVQRMVALLATETCASIRTLAAVTFTRKAAAELRSRFHLALEAAAREATGGEKARLQRALGQVEQCFIGTIHSFCARLLRERPVEAGVDLAFQELEEEEEALLRDEAWEEYTARVFAEGAPEADALAAVGLELRDLQSSFSRFVGYPDVEEWPAPEMGLPNLGPAVKAVLIYVAEMEALLPHLPDDWGNDSLIPRYRRLPRLVQHHDLDDPVQFTEVLGQFDASAKVVQKEWAKTGVLEKEDAKEAQARWDGFRDEVAVPLLRAWREYRYPRVLRVLQTARAIYDDLRAARGLLGFHRLLCCGPPTARN
jgi:ATP-dependent helicase/nuclease subunit A